MSQKQFSQVMTTVGDLVCFYWLSYRC